MRSAEKENGKVKALFLRFDISSLFMQVKRSFGADEEQSVVDTGLGLVSLMMTNQRSGPFPHRRPPVRLPTLAHSPSRSVE